MVTAVQNLPTNDVVPYGDYSSIPAMSASFRNGGVQEPEFGQQGQLVRVRDSNGTTAWINPNTHQLYYLQTGPEFRDQDLSF
jgi:hypothetical protein